MSESKFERVEFISSPEYLKAVENFRKAEMAYLKVGEELYPLSLRYNKIPLTLFCRFILGEFRTQHTARFLIIVIKIYEHFVIFCHMDLDEIAGIDYKILRYICESPKIIFNPPTTMDVINHIKKKCHSKAEAWEYVKMVKRTRKNLIQRQEKAN